MDATGPIFAVLALACLFYIVPRQLSWRIPSHHETEPAARSHLATKTVHTGVPRGQDGPPAAVSTLLMRRAARRAAWRLARRAEKQRRGVFVAVVLITAATVPFAVTGWRVQWWVPLVGAGLTLLWVAYSHIEARRVRRQLDSIVADVELGNEEKTLSVHQRRQSETTTVTTQAPAEIVAPNGDVQPSLWEPITVVPATYMSAPRAARTVRTIDLAQPGHQLPVTEDWPAADQSLAM